MVFNVGDSLASFTYAWLGANSFEKYIWVIRIKIQFYIRIVTVKNFLVRFDSYSCMNQPKHVAFMMYGVTAPGTRLGPEGVPVQCKYYDGDHPNEVVS